MKIKYWFILAVALVVVAALLLSACGTPATTTVTTTTATTTTATTTSTATTTATTTVKPITLKWAYDMPLKVSIAQSWHDYADAVTKETNGMVKFDFYPAAQLMNVTDSPENLKNRIADIGLVAGNISANVFPIWQITQSCGMGFANTVDGINEHANALIKFRETFPAAGAEWKDWKLLIQTGGDDQIIQGTKPLRVPADFKGLKVGSSAATTELIKSLGAAPIPLQPPDIYMNLKTGVIDAAITTWGINLAFKIWEAGPYYYDYAVGGQTSAEILMNWDAWNSLSPDVQAVMTKLVPSAQLAASQINAGGAVFGRQSAKAAGATLATPTPDEIALWQKSIEPIWAIWVDSMTAKGVKDAPAMLQWWKDAQANQAQFK